MKELTPSLLGEIVQRLVNELHPAGVYLFGSHAGGSPRADSDVDLLVVVEETETQLSELTARGRMSLWGLRIPVDLIVCTVADMEKWSDVPCNLLHTVAQRGRLVYASGR